LLAAALLHDIGKAHAGRDHDAVGATELAPHLPAPVVWLVRQHVDLRHHSRRTRTTWFDSKQLARLELLRRYEVAGHDPDAEVGSPEEAVSIVLKAAGKRRDVRSGPVMTGHK
jgi:predicted HD phosphohydrolase